jgi:hypothetical protein
LTASVVTTADVRSTMARLAAAIDSAPSPVASACVRCGIGVTSPCPQRDSDRACGEGAQEFDEYHALVSLPIFQRGLPPYSVGGGIDPMPVLRQDVCMSLTIPNGPIPAGGWPVVIYAHGTGGSFRSHVSPEVAGVLASATPRLAVLGIDQVEHGTRNGAPDKSPDELFYNFRNPEAARGNPLQGAADQLSLARFVASVSVTAAETGGDAIRFDPNAILFWGHSQGATEGSLMLPYGDLFRGAVLSGNGAGLVGALLSKTSPQDIPLLLPLLLEDTHFYELGEFHPVFSILQHWIEPADPVNFALAITREPIQGHQAKHLFQTYGLGDTFAPPVTLATFAIAGGLALVQPDTSVAKADPIGSLVPTRTPAGGNVVVGGRPFTLGVREYAPPLGSDGHYVAFDVPNANQDVVRFLSMIALGQVPDIGN